jgi:hypothetical protein
MKSFKGWRTLAVNAGIAGAAGLLGFLVDVDWTTIVDPSLGIMLVAGINGLLRLITTTGVGLKD